MFAVVWLFFENICRKRIARDTKSDIIVAKKCMEYRKEGTEVEERIEKPEDEYADNCFNRNRDSSVHTVIVSVGKP